MSYVANQYNYATPLQGAVNIGDANYAPSAIKYFTLNDNILDGSFHPISGPVGLWGTSLSDSDGVLAEPLIVTDSAVPVISTLLIAGTPDNFPVTFDITFYNDSEIIYIETFAHNTQNPLEIFFSSPISATHYELKVTKISKPNDVARVYSLYSVDKIKRSISLELNLSESSVSTSLDTKRGFDSLVLDIRESSHILNTIAPTHDLLGLVSLEDVKLTNVHTAMKEPSRSILGKVYITYTDPMLDNETSVVTSGSAHGSNPQQVLDTDHTLSSPLFTLYNNDLSGRYLLSDEASQTGWVSSVVSGPNGYFEEPPYIRVNFSARPILSLKVHFGTVNNCIVENFTVSFIKADGSSEGSAFIGNKSNTVTVLDRPMSNVTAIVISIEKVSKEGFPAIIAEIPVTSTVEYLGHGSTASLINIDLLEELTYLDDVEALGGMSANEVTITLSNEDKQFYFNNAESPIAQHLKRNRKIEPWLGVELAPGLVEWHALGTYWSHNWNVPMGTLTASVVGFDTLGLLGTTLFNKHQVLIDTSIGQLIEHVLDDAKATLSFIKYAIDEELYSVTIPYAWFDASSHAAALRKISECYPIHIYCDRQGTICAKPQKLKLDYFVDTWSDSTNVVDKSYESLYTTLPNLINVTVAPRQLKEQESLAKEQLTFDVESLPTRTYKFSKPFVSDLDLRVLCDDTVEYTYNVYSWGIDLFFTGTGKVTEVECIGTALEEASSSVITYRDDESIRVNGTVTRSISSDFIQTGQLASTLIDRLSSLSENDKYDATVNYRGDISLSINDPIRLLDGIAPDNRYNIKRHQLFWNGGLTGSAELNT